MAKQSPRRNGRTVHRTPVEPECPCEWAQEATHYVLEDSGGEWRRIGEAAGVKKIGPGRWWAVVALYSRGHYCGNQPELDRVSCIEVGVLGAPDHKLVLKRVFQRDVTRNCRSRYKEYQDDAGDIGVLRGPDDATT